MTVPARDLAIRVPCRAPACALRRNYIRRCIVPGSPGPTFWWDPPLAATTYALLPTCTWARLRGWYWLTLIPTTSNRRRCEKRHIEQMLGSLRVARLSKLDCRTQIVACSTARF